jgi:GNAT superfamily N-acetyltransferase
VADDHGRIAATCCIAIIPNLTRQCAPIGFVENIVTHRDYRRQGLGRRVLEAAIAFARARGCYKVLLQSGTKRTEAHRLYEAAGMDGDAKRAFELRL